MFLIERQLLEAQAEGDPRVPFPDPREVETPLDNPVGIDCPKKLNSSPMHAIQSSNRSAFADDSGMLLRRAIIAVIAGAFGWMVVPPSSVTVKEKGKPQAATSPPLGLRNSSSVVSAPCACIACVSLHHAQAAASISSAAMPSKRTVACPSAALNSRAVEVHALRRT